MWTKRGQEAGPESRLQVVTACRPTLDLPPHPGSSPQAPGLGSGAGPSPRVRGGLIPLNRPSASIQGSSLRVHGGPILRGSVSRGAGVHPCAFGAEPESHHRVQNWGYPGPGGAFVPG